MSVYCDGCTLPQNAHGVGELPLLLIGGARPVVEA
jgi:hypothetical protein